MGTSIVEREEIQNIFSPLSFNNTYRYTFPNNIYGDTRFYFTNRLNLFKPNILYIELSAIFKNQNTFNKFITSNNEIEYEKIENDRCITYISIENILNAHIFFKSEKINIFIASESDSFI